MLPRPISASSLSLSSLHGRPGASMLCLAVIVGALSACDEPAVNPDVGLQDVVHDSHVHDAASDAGVDISSDAVTDMTNDDGSTPPQAVCLGATVKPSGGSDVTFCDQAYAERPFIRLPADSATVVYASLHLGEWVTRNGALQPSVPSAITDAEHGPDGVALDRYGYAIYRLTVVGSAVTEASVAVLVDDRLFLQQLQGLFFTGVVARRTSVDQFELVPTLPIAVRMGAALTLSDTPDGLHGYPIHTLAASVVNLTTNVRLPDGSCMPALSAATDSPFASEPGLVFSRIPNMHGGFDDVIVVDFPELGTSNMGNGGYLAPIGLASETPPPSISYGSDPHGAPGYGPSLSIDQVDSLVDGCTL